MIKAELSYNPYVKETQVKFNGQPPRINSLIEKYQNRPLQDWISDIPMIFRDEMNGYGFELDFRGTELDYNEVCNAFSRQGVTRKDVLITLTEELECREIKIERIRDLLDWLSKHPYRNFDYEGFRLEHHELLDSVFVCVVLHGDTPKPELKNITVERVNDVSELACTDLTHTPILFCISEETIGSLQNDLSELRQRKDITDEQLFFCIGGKLKAKMIRRLLKDHGIEDPSIVTDINDELMRKYYLVYPFCDYIAGAVSILQKAADDMTAIVEEDNRKNKLKGDQTHEQLAQINDAIQRIQEADRCFLSPDNTEFPPEFGEITKDLLGKLSTWETKKTKITDPAIARTAAAEYNAALQRYVGECSTLLKNATINNYQKIHNKYRTWYSYAAPDGTFTDNVNFMPGVDHLWVEPQTANLLNLKEDKYVDRKNKGFVQIFRVNESDNNQPVLETTYYYQTWRDHMIHVVMPEVEKFVKEKYDLLTDYAERLTNIYHKQMQCLLQAELAKKEQVSANLSEDEKLLQADNEWLGYFTSRLESIERS